MRSFQIESVFFHDAFKMVKVLNLRARFFGILIGRCGSRIPQAAKFHFASRSLRTSFSKNALLSHQNSMLVR